MIVIILFLVLGAIAAILIIVMGRGNQEGVYPTSIKLPLIKGTTMKLGTSRVLDVVFFSGQDDRTKDNFQVVTQK